ncbi:MAG: BON domain-containing protein [Bryobacterales bacterium]|nr:BON domain-containing protein [Bryobacterales bacterium]
MIWLRILICSACLALAAFAQTATSDDHLYDQVRIKLAQDIQVNGGAIEVRVKDAVVTLIGKIRTEKAKSKAEKIAGKVKGVKKVVNELVVDPNAP